MKKVVFIISQSLSGGGAERVASNLSLEFAKNPDYKTYLVLFDGNGQAYPNGVDIINLNLGPCSGAINKIAVFFRRIIRIHSLKKKYNVDISISLLSIPNLVNVLSRAKDSTIVSVRNLISKSARSKFEKLCVRFSSKRADKTVALSELVRIDLIDNFNIPANKVVTIYNTCDAGELLRLTESSNVDVPAFPYIVTMGRLMRQKGQWHLINAFKRIHQQNNSLHLVILGKGELEISLKKLAQECGISEYVHFLGYVVNPHLIIKNAQIFVFPSLFEGLGNVLLEAMACGVPVISMDCQAGPKEIISKQNKKEELTKTVAETTYSDYGVLIPPFDAGDEPFDTSRDLSQEEIYLADAVLELSKNHEKLDFYKQQSGRRIKDFSPCSIMNQWYQLLNEIRN